MIIELKGNYGDYNCGNTAIAVLNINGVSIPLCSDCIDYLVNEVDQFKNTNFCYQCKHFGQSKSGFKYGGSCIKDAVNQGKILKEYDYEHLFCKDSMDTCNRAEAL